MSRVYLSHLSAFYYIREKRNLGVLDCCFTSKQPDKTSEYDISDNYLWEYKNSNGKIDVIVKNSNKKSHSKFLNYHCYKAFLPKSFMEVSDGVFVPCPELLFIQLSSILTFGQLLLAGYEMCGFYSINRDYDIGFTNGQPIVSKSAIQSYCSRIQKRGLMMDGLQNAAYTAKYLKDKSASPQESNLSIKLCAPTCKGGFGLKEVLLNEPIELTRAAYLICKQHSLYPDFMIKRYKIAGEYDSSAFHEKPRQNRKDKQRLDALVHDGWKVFSFVDVQLHDVDAFTNLAYCIRRCAGQRAPITVRNWEARRKELWDDLNKSL